MKHLEPREKTILMKLPKFCAGMCVVPPVIRNSSHTPHKKQEAEIRCQSCWLKLCLIGYNLETQLYDSLRQLLPKVIQDQIPEGDKRNQSQSLLPHR